MTAESDIGMAFEPIAIVGRGCVLPGALDPDTFSANIVAGRLDISATPEDRWRLPLADVLGGGGNTEVTYSAVGGYVHRFESVFDPTGYAVDAADVRGLEPLNQWVLHAARAALREAGQDGPLPRAGLVTGNLSFPSAGLASYAEHVWFERQPPEIREALEPVLTDVRRDAGDRFSSGRPAHLAARALGLGAGAFALDAACASGLYAVKIACDRLHDRHADLMVAGAVNCPDDLFIHLGFSALEALSPSGRSRPFHPDADGLVPAEGAAFVALMRLSDALAAGHEIHGVIRGVGLSNDGRAGGLLVPSPEGQERAMRLAYEIAGVAPESVSLLECHATGTPVGDEAEIRGAGRVFAQAEDLPIGSAKSNVGHLVTAAGVAGLLKVLGAMRSGVRPPTLGAEETIGAFDGTPLRVLREAEEWRGPHRAAVSAFGFGGNNAHLIVDGWDPGTAAVSEPMPSGPRRAAEPVAIVAMGARVADGRDERDFVETLLTGVPGDFARTTVEIELAGLRFPPKDLEQTHAQQLLVLEAAREAARGVTLPSHRTAVLVGMGCDAEVARYGARWRSREWLRRIGITDAQAVTEFRDAFVAPLTSAGVLGTMPNVVANRINAQLDLGGPSFTVSAEEASGVVALRIAERAIQAGEIDAAVVGATDLSQEPVHRSASAELGLTGAPGDAAVVLVLKRLSDAQRDNDPVLAILDSDAATAGLVVGDDAGFDPAMVFGRAHAASGLLSVAAAAAAVRYQAMPRVNAPAAPALGAHVVDAVVRPLEAAEQRVRLRGHTPRAWVREAPPRPRVFSGSGKAAVLDALESGRESQQGPSRLVILAAGESDLPQRAAAARTWLTDGGRRPDGMAFREAPLTGEVGFVFAGGSMAYPGMGRELMLAFPSRLRSIEDRCGPLREVAGWAYDEKPPGTLHVLEQIWGASLLAQLHASITRDLLGLTPQAVLGYSSGESAALSAMGVWSDTAALIADARASELFSHELVGDIAAFRRVWARWGVAGDRWASYLVSASAEEIRELVRDEPAVHLMMVNSPGSCVVGGEAESCQRVLGRVASGVAIPIDYEIAVHAPELAEVREQWWRLHHRPVTELPGVRFYRGATTDWYHPTSDTAADALTEQAVTTVDFAGTIERAWQDGVRVFIEHGPRGLCTNWIGEVLGDREHLAVALDSPDGRDLRRLSQVVAELLAAGVPVDQTTVVEYLSGAVATRPDPGIRLELPAHPPEVRLPDVHATTGLEEPVEVMQPAPALPVPLAPALAASPAVAAPAPAVRPAASPGSAPIFPAQARHIAETHTSFLANQAEVHRRFLALQQRAHQELLRRRSGLVPAPVRPVVAAPVESASSPAAGDPRPVESIPESVPAVLPGPKFDRAQLEHLAGKKISDLFGPLFRPQDDYAKQTRMPLPPMLLADRVTGIEAVAGSMGTGTIWTETDVTAESWYLDPTGRMPAGLMIEAGQADLLLISWLGVDLLNRGERVYRLLGCDLTFHGSPAAPGETLAYRIDIDGHGEQGGIRLFFFHYDCTVGTARRMSVQNGQAGFFTDAELAATGGVLWDPAADAPTDSEPLDPPAIAGTARSFGADKVRAFAEGRPADCFGEGWDRARAHVRSPRIANEEMLFLHEITEFDVAGGPWGRGYLRAETAVSPDDWYFEGHFLNDPCMPGTLMFEGCLQAMSFYLAATGFTVERDGWRFEPVPERTYRMRCRGQVTPESRKLTYEIFVAGLSGGAQPELIADVLVTVDGVKAFHARRVGLRLVPDWPLTRWREQGARAGGDNGDLRGLVDHPEPAQAAVVDGFRFDYASLLACAWGKPSEAFGKPYAVFDGTRRVARLPGPPYHFMSRVVSVEGPQGGLRVGSRVVVDYDVPDKVWYWEQNANPTMPLAVLMEVALQPCGWLASFVGSALTTETDLLFRNLDGDGVVTGEITPGTRTIRTTAKLTRISRNGDIIIESFEVECVADGTSVFTLTTVFGYFPPEAFDDQKGLPPSAEERARIEAPGNRLVDLTDRSGKHLAGPLRLPGPMLLMIDRITGYWPDGGRAGLGRLRAEKDVDPGEWFFKAHFFQDPVQPGSLGVEAMCQLLQFYLIETDAGAEMTDPRFQPVLPGSQTIWKYRGQVIPVNRTIVVELEILETGQDGEGRFAIAEGWLWVDGKRIYQAPKLGMRVLPGEAVAPAERHLTTALDSWLLDHRPTWTVPAVPMMSIVDLMAEAVEKRCGERVTALRDVRIHRWLPVPERLRLTTEVTPSSQGWEVTVLAWRDAENPALSRFEPVATGTVSTGSPGPVTPEFAPLSGAEPVDDPYGSGTLFHGPAFQYLISLQTGDAGASGILDAARGSVPRSVLHQGLLDAATHVIPHDFLRSWSDQIAADVVGFPVRVVSMDVFEPLPDKGEVAVEARFAGFDGDDRRYPVFDVRLSFHGRVLVAFRLVDVLLPKGTLGAAEPALRQRFLRDREYADGLGLSVHDGPMTRISATEVDLCDWLPGTVAEIYGLPRGARGRDHLEAIAVRDHVGRLLRVHPSELVTSVDATGWTAYPAGDPARRCRVSTQRTGETVVARSADSSAERIPPTAT